MLIVERTVETASPIDRVFDYLSDFTHTEEWDPVARPSSNTG